MHLTVQRLFVYVRSLSVPIFAHTLFYIDELDESGHSEQKEERNGES